MKKSQQALAPSFFQSVTEESSKVIKRKPKKQDEDILVQLAENDAWQRVKDIIKDMRISLWEATRVMSRESKTLEELGLRYAIFDQVDAAYQSVIDLVELPYEARKYERLAKNE